ncbi:hypothetical protein DLM45_04135 [Hyphomicrobium methylovorum]|uniref:copper uptake system-associated protein n=1 Tax=Hyphomicrobium methylovorum TaxID=84 RepID=UPI0015E7612C|nr:copper uptake system-associated protein [Hyphomicrobium methylovorum]MBA2125412.1 hypothetical protein [Hyphomicrobium methylovorum]
MVSFSAIGALLFAGFAIGVSGGLEARADNQSSDEDQISLLIKTTWEKPDQPMSVAPIVVSGTYAVAGWSEKARGGRALLKNGDGRWRVILCAGDGIRTAPGLVAAGIPAETAEALATQIAQREAELPPDQVAKFSLFEGVVDMGGGEHHHPH